MIFQNVGIGWRHRSFIPVYNKINVKQSLHYKEIEFQIFMYLQVKYWDLQENTCIDDIYELTPEEIVNDFKEGTLKFIGTYCFYYLYFKKYFI
jgi:1-deoxy-D-xylulose 5-phosphate reductoisomerase